MVPKTTFWVTSLTLEEEYTSIGASDHFFIAIFELFRKNCLYTADDIGLTLCI